MTIVFVNFLVLSIVGLIIFPLVLIFFIFKDVLDRLGSFGLDLVVLSWSTYVVSPNYIRIITLVTEVGKVTTHL